jgi:threonyl-tRNA synthetase
VEADTRNERLQYKIREAQLQKTPYMLVVGDNEAAAGTVSVRLRSGEKREAVPVETLINEIAELNRTRAR